MCYGSLFSIQPCTGMGVRISDNMAGGRVANRKFPFTVLPKKFGKHIVTQ